jgi:VIT1/CCC1 family predicted Fe2+/Mn2+ transporter
MASLLWGMFVIIVLSYFLAKAQKASPIMIIGEHLGIAVLVVVLSHLIGVWVSKTFT